MNKFLLLSLLMLSISQNVNAQSSGYGNFISCNSINMTPQVIFKLSYGELKHDLGKSGEEITKLSKNSKEERHSFMKGKGLATLDPLLNIELREFDTQTIDDKNSCVYPRVIEVKFGYNNPVVYVNNAYEATSCNYAYILRHQQVHQRLNKITLEYFAPIFYSAIRRAVSDVRALKVSKNNKQEEVAKTLTSYYEAILKPVAEQFTKIRQDQLKNFDEWEMENSQEEVCKEYDEKKKLMDHAFD